MDLCNLDGAWGRSCGRGAWSEESAVPFPHCSRVVGGIRGWAPGRAERGGRGLCQAAESAREGGRGTGPGLGPPRPAVWAPLALAPGRLGLLAPGLCRVPRASRPLSGRPLVPSLAQPECRAPLGLCRSRPFSARTVRSDEQMLLTSFSPL